MAKILIVYGTTEGHTRKIAEFVGERAQASGHVVTVIDSANVPPELAVPEYDAYILAGSLHMQKHQAPLAHFAKVHRGELNSKPGAFLSASLTASNTDEKHRQEAQACIDKFLEESGWRPTATTPVAGALLYLEYDWIKRMLLRAISKSEGGPTDTSKDYEFTDWEKLGRFVDEFLTKDL